MARQKKNPQTETELSQTEDQLLVPNSNLVPKDKMKDEGGRPYTQSLFLEIGYTDQAIYTTKDHDHLYKGHLYPSLKRLYLEEEDPTEYDFSVKYLLGWNHWLRLCENKTVRKHIDEWREELELKLRSRAVKQMIKNAAMGKIQAQQWVANKGWSGRIAGRPSKADIDSEKKFQSRVADEYSADVVRLHGV
jgi:hypothetical protein